MFLPLFILISFLSILLYVLFLPFACVFGWLLLCRVWIESEDTGKDLLFVEADSDQSREWIPQIMPLVAERGMFLNYSRREAWDRWSLPVQLFDIFGPHPVPQSFTKHYLPSVVIFRKFRRPGKFNFGSRSKASEATLERLRSELAED